jgi:hypothetical protein
MLTTLWMHAAKLPTNRLRNPLNSRSDRFTIAVKFEEKRKKWSTALIKLAIDRTKADSHYLCEPKITDVTFTNRPVLRAELKSAIFATAPCSARILALILIVD